MSRFGWAYVNDVITGSGGTPGGSDKAIQFASGSTFSGSTNFTFDYTSNTVRLTGTLHADNLIVSSSTIYKSGSTIFGDDNTDTHQFTGSVYSTGILSSSNDIYSAASIQAKNNITATTGTISSSLGFLTSGSVQSVGNITTTGGSVSSSVALNTAGTLAVGNSAIIGTGLTVLANGFNVTGSSFVTGVLSASFIQADGFEGYGTQIVGIQGSNVDGVGDDWSIQFKSGNTGTLTGSSNLTFSGSTLTLTGSLLMSGASSVVGVDYIDFDISASIPAFAQRRLFYDNNFNDLAYYTPVNGVQVNLGQQTVAQVKNMTGATISKGKLVHIVGGVGDNPLINTASWDNDTNSANTLGMVMKDILDNESGFIMLNGVITGVNTDPAIFTAGQIIYLSSSGNYTATQPVAPKHTVRLGEVVRAHATVGSIFIKIDNGYELGELHDVLVTSASTGDLLVYNSGSGLWNNTRVLSGSYTVTGTLSASAISASIWYGLPSTTTNPGGVNTNIQFNSGSTFSGSNNLTYNYTTSLLAVTGNVGLYAGTLNFAGNSANFNFADDSQILVTNDNSGDLIKVTSPSFGGRSTIDIGNLTGARDLTVNIQGIADDYLNITIPTSGTTAQFTSITGTLNGTASYALNANLFDGRDSTTFASTGSNTFVGDQTVTGNLNVSGVIDARGIPFVSSLTSLRRSIQLFPGAGSMMNTVSPIDSTANSPFAQAGTATQAFSNGYAIIGYTQATTATYGITTQDVGSTKVLCTPQRGPSWKGSFRTGNDLTSKRIFVGFEEYAGNKDADDPANGYAHLSYSSVRGDSTFKIITRTANGVGSQTLIDTGISASISTNYYFDMKLTSGSFAVTLTSGSSTYAGSVTSSLPNVTASLGVCAAAKNAASVSRTFSIYFLEFNDS